MTKEAIATVRLCWHTDYSTEPVSMPSITDEKGDVNMLRLP